MRPLSTFGLSPVVSYNHCSRGSALSEHDSCATSEVGRLIACPVGNLGPKPADSNCRLGLLVVVHDGRSLPELDETRRWSRPHSCRSRQRPHPLYPSCRSRSSAQSPRQLRLLPIRQGATLGLGRTRSAGNTTPERSNHSDLEPAKILLLEAVPMLKGTGGGSPFERKSIVPPPPSSQ